MTPRENVPKTDDREQGAALLSALMIMLLMAGVTAGFTALVITDTRVRVMDSTRVQSFYAAHAGLEQLTAQLGDLFASNVAPSAAQVNALMDNPPDVGVNWERPDGTSGYRITFPVDEDGNAAATVMTVQNGPFQGLVGLATNYEMEVTGRLRRIQDGGEVSLTRRLQTIAIPVFQFGIFSQNDLSFFPGPTFNFGGRVHSNASVFLATRAAAPGLTLSERVTAVGEVVRRRLSNGMSTESEGYTGVVRAITAPNTFRNLAMTEGSVQDGLGSAVNEPAWTNLSNNTYNSNVMNGRTGARRLDLPIAMFGDGPIDLIRRPAPNENVDKPNLLAERFYSLASLRILLSDVAANISTLPGIDTSVAPTPLGITEPYAFSAGTPRVPFAQSPAPGSGVHTALNSPLLGGYLKIEKQTSPGTWVDVTQQILQYGIAARQWTSDATGAAPCTDIQPNAIVRLQVAWGNTCLTTATTGAAAGQTANNTQTAAAHTDVATRYAPNVLYDPREALLRDTAPTSMQFGGLMHYVEIDARNLSRWFQGTLPGGGTQGTDALRDGAAGGFTVYFSDRRGNRNDSNQETGEYGFEDFVNPTSATGTPNNTLETGEDVNENEARDNYGRTPRLDCAPGAAPATCVTWAAAAGPFVATARPETGIGTTNATTIARRNPPIFFRRALKLSNGATNLVAPGLTIASENPVYVHGNWNSAASTCTVDCFNGTHVATAVIADAVTLLSNNWNDRNSFVNPHAHNNSAQRNAVTTWYRMAVIAGKGISFPRPTAGTPAGDFGTDGGAHNFLRFMENWDGDTLYYRGSIASLFVSRQAVGTYKCCNTVYAAPSRGYNFDTEFLTPALLPPRTPMFRDVNITGFAQIIRP